jgi:hypothetical protein
VDSLRDFGGRGHYWSLKGENSVYDGVSVEKNDRYNVCFIIDPVFPGMSRI